jgi:hypothetical protein
MKLDLPQMAQMLMYIGDVVPFRRQSIEPGMGLTEGARPYGGGAEARPMQDTPEWRAYQADLTRRLADQIRAAADKAGYGQPIISDQNLSPTQKYEMALRRQRGE